MPEPPGQTHPAADAAARLTAVRAALDGGAAIPAPVWEDAATQLTGMLQALAALQEDVPALAPPGATLPPAASPPGAGRPA